MPARTEKTSPSDASWEDVRHEAEKLAQEMILDSLAWTRKAWKLANMAGERMASASEKAADRVEKRFSKD